MTIISVLHALDTEACREALTRCCGASRWVEGMLAGRPFADDKKLLEAASRIWRGLGRADIMEAFSHHPKIGSSLESLRQKFPTTEAWSSQEQASVQHAKEETLQALAEGNRLYEDTFGYIFIVCATGKTAAEMLSLLRQRLLNPPDLELRIAAGEQEKITAIRLQKLGGVTMVSPITTHVLDTHLGKPAPGLEIQLSKRQDSGSWLLLARGTTDADGRIRDLLAPGSLQPGIYQMRFETQAYFVSRQIPYFYPEAVVTFEIVETSEHYHIPLLLSPFGYSTYRGS